MAAHKDARKLLLEELICNWKPVRQPDFIKKTGISTISAITAIRTLEADKIIKVKPKREKGRRGTPMTNYLFLNSDTENTILDGVFLQILGPQKEAFLLYLNKGGSPLLKSSTFTPTNPFKNGYLSNNLTPFQKPTNKYILNTPKKKFIPLIQDLSNKIFPLATGGGPEGADLLDGSEILFHAFKRIIEKGVSPTPKGEASATSDLESFKEILSSPDLAREVIKTCLAGVSKKTLPIKAPLRLDPSFKNHRLQQYAAEFGFREGARRIYTPPPAVSGWGEIDWQIIIETAEKSFFPYYTGLHPSARDLAFAEAFIDECARARRYNEEDGIVQLIRNPAFVQMKKSRIWKALRRARVWADFRNARYEDWCEIISNHYEAYPCRDGDGKVYPFRPENFSGPAARGIYENEWESRTRVSRLNRSEIERLDPDFLPENYVYPGTDKQNQFFAKVLFEAQRLARALGIKVEKKINDYIDECILPKEFAESPFNVVCPEYRYEKSWRSSLLA